MSEALRGYEVAKLIGCTVSNIDTWRKTRGFPNPTVKLSRERLYDRNAVMAWVKAQEDSP